MQLLFQIHTVHVLPDRVVQYVHACTVNVPVHVWCIPNACVFAIWISCCAMSADVSACRTK